MSFAPRAAQPNLLLRVLGASARTNLLFARRGAEGAEFFESRFAAGTI